MVADEGPGAVAVLRAAASPDDEGEGEEGDEEGESGYGEACYGTRALLAVARDRVCGCSSGRPACCRIHSCNSVRYCSLSGGWGEVYARINNLEEHI